MSRAAMADRRAPPWRCGARWALLGVLFGGAAPAWSQQPPATSPPQPASSGDDHLFGNWGGIRTSLGNLGIDLNIDLTSELAGNVGGGTQRGATFANQVAVEADIDWDRLAGIPGLTTHAVIANRSGSSDSALFGDHVNAVQEIYGGGGDVIAHFVYAYAEESLWNGRLDVAAGRMPVLNDFAASKLYCNFMNVSICGNPGSLSAGDIGFSVFPDATWGGRARVRPTPDTYVQAGAYEVSRGLFVLPYFRSGWNFDTSRDSGVELPLEIGYEPTFGAAALPGHYKLGFGYDSSNNPDLYLDAAGVPALLSGQPYANHHGQIRAWALADQMLIRNGPGDDDGLILFGAFVHGDPNISGLENQYTAGLLDQGFWRARPKDTIGMLVTYQTISGALGKQEALEQEFGMPLPTGVTGLQSSEMVFELNYDIQVTSGVNLQPEFQYVIRPNAQNDIKNATVFGLKTHVKF